MKNLILVFLAAAGVVAACSSSSTPNSGACTTDADCQSGYACAYNDASGCNATPSCQLASPAQAPPYKACGCQGQPVSFVAQGFTTAPVVSGSPCPTDAGTDASVPPVDSGTDAPATSNDGSTDAPASGDGSSTDSGGNDSGGNDASSSDSGDGGADQ